MAAFAAISGGARRRCCRRPCCGLGPGPGRTWSCCSWGPACSPCSLAAAVSESSLLAGRIEFFELQNPAKAQASFVIALQAAQDAQDVVLGSAVLAHMAFIPAFSGDTKRADEARNKIRAACAFARRASASPEMRAWLDAVEAEVETRFGNTGKALQLIHNAEDIFATEEPRPSPAWLDWFSPLRVAGFKGNTLLIARQPGPARYLAKCAR
jgi:hypothetical protein